MSKRQPINHLKMTKEPGLTIVELLIVIVVIAILAAISIVAYNGIQQRANNTKTVNAVGAYVKALGMYKTTNDTYPNVSSCLGVGYAGGTCRSDTSWVENGSNLNSVILEPYLKGAAPTPALIPVAFNSTLTMTGAFYTYGHTAYNPTGPGLGVMHLGTGQCPNISGTSLISFTPTIDSNMLCRYAITL